MESLRTTAEGMPAPKSALFDLVDGHAGLVSAVHDGRPRPGEPRFAVSVAELGDLSRVLPHVARRDDAPNGGQPDGAGSDVDLAASRLKAVAEALERYASFVFAPEQFTRATAAELGDEALDLTTVPRCSAAELAHPRCPVVAPDPDAPMRWVRGVSLIDGRLRWVPAVMVHLHLDPEGPGERFWAPTSTGCAVHTSLERALVAAICEVVERDALAVTWLQRVALPRLVLDDPPEALRRHLRVAERARDIRHHLFDATSDLGVPTVYGVQVAPRDTQLAAIVMCATDLSPATAVAKVLRETAASRIALRRPYPLPASWDDFDSVYDGAVLMGRPAHLGAFDFLLASRAERRLGELPALETDDPRADLRALVGRLRARGFEAVAVELTTDEAVRVGARVVRVVIPALQPITFSHRARYLGHPRLYDAPRRMGHPAHPEHALNPWPQPFA